MTDELAAARALLRQRFEPAGPGSVPFVVPVERRELVRQERLARASGARPWQRAVRRRERREAGVIADARYADVMVQATREHQRLQDISDRAWRAVADGEEAAVTTAITSLRVPGLAPLQAHDARDDRAAIVISLPAPPTGPDPAYLVLAGAHLLTALRACWAAAPTVQRIQATGLTSTDLGRDVLFTVEADREPTANYDDDGYGVLLLGDAVETRLTLN